MELYKTVIDGEQFTVRPKPTEKSPERAKVTFDSGSAVFPSLAQSQLWDTEDQSSGIQGAAKAYAEWLADSAERLSVPTEDRALTPYDTGDVLEPKIWPTDGDPTRFGKVDFDNDDGTSLFTVRMVATPYGFRLEVEIQHGHALDVRVTGQ